MTINAVLTEITFSTFAIKVEPVAREIASVVYVEGQRDWRFSAERSGPDWRQIDVVIDELVSREDRARIVENLALGLGRLGFGYAIRRELPRMLVPDVDRQRAIADLRAMGMELRPAKGNVPEHWVSTSGSYLTDGIHLTTLIAEASGTRRQFEVLAEMG